MNKHTHIVRVHPVESGEPNLHRVTTEHEFLLKNSAIMWVESFNCVYAGTEDEPEEFKAVYYGCVNDETGELV